MLFASDFGSLIPGWVYILIAIIAIIVVALFLAAGVIVLVALARFFSRLLSGDAQKISRDRDSDRD
jgi:hypothetical protein